MGQLDNADYGSNHDYGETGLNSRSMSLADKNNFRRNRANFIGNQRDAANDENYFPETASYPGLSSNVFPKAARDPALIALLHWHDAKGEPVHLFGIYLHNPPDEYSDDYHL